MIAILGGGISGLSAAYQLQKAGKEFILLEQGSQLGGKIKSTQINGFTVEQGPNTVLVNNREIKELIKELGLWDDLIFPDENASKNRLVLKQGSIEPFPSSLSRAFRSKLFTAETLLTILKEPFQKAKEDDREESLADFIERRLSKQILDDFITPFVTGIYAGDPKKMSVNYCMNILKDAEKLHGSIIKGMFKLMKAKKDESEHLGLPKQKIFTFKNGLRQLIDTIHESIHEHVALQSSIQEIIPVGHQYKIVYQQHDEVKEVVADHVICCLPAYATASVCEKFAPTLTHQLRKINYVPAIAIHLGFQTSQMKFNQKAFGILSRNAEQVPFLGVLFNSHFFPHTSPSDKDLITVICGGSRYPELIHKSDEEVLTEIKNSIRQLLGISGAFEVEHLIRWEKGIPQYELGYQAIEKEINNFLRTHPNFSIAANYFKGISVSDCVKNGYEVVHSILNP